MKFSIVTISFNQAQYLEQALRSVIEQNDVDLEYIVVDPGSSDGSRALIERFRDKLAHVVLEQDRGPADGLNKGFARASGDVFGFLNSDDYLLPNALRTVQDYLHAHPDIDVVSGHAVIVDRSGRVLRRSYSEPYSARMDALRAAILMQPSTFFRVQAFRKAGGFNPANKVAWDGELFFRMHRLGARFAVMGEFLSAYRVHEGSITGSARLDEGIKEYRRGLFREYYGRDPHLLDLFLMGGARVFKHLRNLRALRERILHGPIYGRARKP
jgi:glycosyltransferase involved in cell wall biosynthesis